MPTFYCLSCVFFIQTTGLDASASDLWEQSVRATSTYIFVGNYGFYNYERKIVILPLRRHDFFFCSSESNVSYVLLHNPPSHCLTHAQTTANTSAIKKLQKIH